MNPPIVSVVMLTYKHEMFIKQAIEGVLMQNGDFKIELIIADDSSPDNTEIIVKQIIETHPNGYWIKYTKHTTNKGIMNNFIWALNQCQGDFIALCEGDDYWKDPLKLQKQVDFFKQHPDYSICTHNVRTYKEKTKTFTTVYPGNQTDMTFTINDLVTTLNLHTCSFLIRKKHLTPIPDWFKDVWHGDFFTAAYLLTKGKGMSLKDEMGVYRSTEKGQSIKEIQSRISLVEKNLIGHKNMLLLLHKNNEIEYYKKRINDDLWHLLDYSIALGDKNKIKKYLFKLCYKIKTFDKFRVKLLIIGFLKLIYPFKLKQQKYAKGI